MPRGRPKGAKDKKKRLRRTLKELSEVQPEPTEPVIVKRLEEVETITTEKVAVQLDRGQAPTEPSNK